MMKWYQIIICALIVGISPLSYGALKNSEVSIPYTELDDAQIYSNNLRRIKDTYKTIVEEIGCARSVAQLDHYLQQWEEKGYVVIDKQHQIAKFKLAGRVIKNENSDSLEKMFADHHYALKCAEALTTLPAEHTASRQQNKLALEIMLTNPQTTLDPRLVVHLKNMLKEGTGLLDTEVTVSYKDCCNTEKTFTPTIIHMHHQMQKEIQSARSVEQLKHYMEQWQDKGYVYVDKNNNQKFNLTGAVLTNGFKSSFDIIFNDHCQALEYTHALATKDEIIDRSVYEEYVSKYIEKYKGCLSADMIDQLQQAIVVSKQKRAKQASLPNKSTIFTPTESKSLISSTVDDKHTQKNHSKPQSEQQDQEEKKAKIVRLITFCAKMGITTAVMVGGVFGIWKIFGSKNKPTPQLSAQEKQTHSDAGTEKEIQN